MAGKYEDAIGGVNINLSINEVLDEKSHKKVADKIDETKKNAEKPIKIKIDSGEMDELLNQEKEIVKTIKQLGRLKVDAKGISGLLNGGMSKADIQKTIDALNSLYEVQNKIRQVSGNTKRTGSDFLSGFSANDIKTDLLPKLQEQLSELNKLGLDNIEQLRERERLQGRLSKITKKDLERAKARVVDGGDADLEAKAIENIVIGRRKVVEEMKTSGLFSEQEIKDIERQNKGLAEQIALLRSIRVAKVKDGEKIVVQKDGDKTVSLEEGELPPARKPRAQKPKTETPPPIVTENSALQQLKRDAETASKAFGEAENKLHDIYEAERKLDEQIELAGLVDYSEKYKTAINAREQALSGLRGGISKKRDHVAKEIQVRGAVGKLKDSGALSDEALASIQRDVLEYNLAVRGKYEKTTKEQLDKMFAKIFDKIDKSTLKQTSEYRNLGWQQEEQDINGLLAKKRQLAVEHKAAAKAYNDAADASSEAHKKLHAAEDGDDSAVRAAEEKARLEAEAAAAEKARLEEEARLREETHRAEEARRAEEERFAREREEAERRALELAQQRAEEEARIAAEKEKQSPQSSAGTQQEIKSQEELQKKIEDTNRIIKIQKQWLEYLDPVLDDENFKTSGKREATEQLKSKTLNLLDVRRNPDQYAHLSDYEIKAELAQSQAYKEAERQGVALSTLTRYHTDAVFVHDQNIKKLQDERALHAKILEDAENELEVLQKQLQVETNAEKVRKHNFKRTVNEKPGRFRIKKQESQAYETESGQLSLFPDAKEDIETADNLAEANEKVAKSRKKVNDAVEGTQMTIDDIVPASAEDAAPKVEAEAKAIDKVGKTAEKAAGSKKKFAKANSEVAASTTPSIEGLKAEADAIEDVDEAVNSFKTRSGIGPMSGFGSESMDNFNLPKDYLGEKGQDAVQMFAKLKSEIEELTGKPVTIDFVSDVNDEGQLEAVGATLKYVNEEAGVTVKQFYDIQRNQDGILTAVQSHEKATLAASKAAKAFNTEMQQKLALEQVKTLESRMGSLKDTTGEFALALRNAQVAAKKIDGEEGLKEFNLSLRVAGEKAKQLKSGLKGQNTLDTIASMERALLTLPSRLDEVKRRLNALGDVDGADAIGDVLRSVNEEYQQFLSSNNSEDKVKLFRSLTSSMVWANAEMRNLSGKSAEIKRQETEVDKEELAKQKLERASYIGWWKDALNEQAEEEDKVRARQKQEQSYSDWWNKALFDQEQAEKAKDERVIAARKKREEEYEKWWLKALHDREQAEQKKADAPNLNYGKTTASSAVRKRDNIQGEIDALGVINPEILAKIDAYKAKVKEVVDLRDKFAGDSSVAKDPELVKQFQKASAEAERARRGIKAVIDEEQKMIQMSEEQGFFPKDLAPDQMSDLQDTMLKLVKTTSQGRVEIKGWNDDNTKLYYTVTDSKGAVEEMTMALGQGTNRLYQYRTATKETGTLFEQVFKGIKVKAKELLSFVIGGGSVYKVIELFRQGIQYVREIDLALTELKKVTDETEESYDRFLETAAKTGARLGTTISAVTEATATFAKLGYTMEQATEMAESAIVYKNVGDNIASTEDAADSIISTMKGFRLEASESMAIVDRFNEVGNRFAITSQGIGEALRLSASALSEGGNSLDESIALIAAANEVVNDPSSVGTALKTLTLRLRGSKTELEEMGEDVTDMATTTSQLQAKLLALTGGQVDIMLDENTFKNSTQILREMAEAWEDMNDIQRASALELMGGKRQANVLSALIQNFDTVEKAIETSANSAGSALKENERYLDSIQGKIDQFNNALQSMWSGTLDSGLVKWFVNLGTELVKVVDTLGLIPSILLSIGSFKILQSLFKGTDIIGFIKSIGALTMGTKVFEAETRKASFALIGETINTKLAGSALVEYAVKMKLAKAADISKMTTTQLLGLSFKALGVAILDATKAVLAFLFTNPVGWIILAIGAIAGGVAIFNHFHKTTEELTEELGELKNELRDIQGELESLNSELERTESRMAELLAMDSLSFAEKEELDRLRKQNDELQRSIDLNEQKQKNAQRAAEKTFVQVAESIVDKDTYDYGGKRGFWDKLFGSQAQAYGQSMSADEYIDAMMVEYDKHLEYQKDQEANGYNWWTAKDPKANPEKYAGQIQDYIDQLTEAADGIDYDTAGTATKEWLDYIYNLEDKWAIHQGGENAKTNAITRIFNKDEFEGVSEEIDSLVKKYKATGDATILDQIGIQASKAKEDLDAVGLSVDNVVDYFTLESNGPNLSTIEGITEVYQDGINILGKYKNARDEILGQDENGENITWNNLFTTDEDGKKVADNLKIASILEGSDEAIRQEFTKMVEAVENGEMEVDAALAKWNVSGFGKVLDNLNNEFESVNNEMFANIADDIHGLIDTVSELQSALEDVAGTIDLLSVAEEQMANSGQISVKTALDLMETTDDYSKVVTVQNGVLKLATGAQEYLTQSKFNSIKTQLEASAALAENTYQTALASNTELDYADNANVVMTAESIKAEAIGRVSAVVVALGAAMDEIMAGNFGSAFSSFGSTYKSATATVVAQSNAMKTSIAELQRDAENKRALADVYSFADDYESFKNNYDFDKTPGDKYDDDKDAALDAFQRAMDYWENRIAANQARYDQLQNDIDLLESKNQKASTEYYKEQIGLLQEFNDKGVLVGGTMHLLAQKRSEAYTYLKSLQEGSEEWWEVANVINDIESEIDEVTASVVDLQDAMAETEWYKYEEFGNRLDDITSKLETIRNLIAPNGEEDWFDDEGNWNEAGVAYLGSYIQDLADFNEGLARAKEEYAKYTEEYAGNEGYYANLGIHSEQELYDKREELIEQQYDYAESINDTEQSVIDMYESNIDAIEEYTDKLVDSYNDYIDSVKEALDAERDLYNFKKNVQKQTKDIAAIERRIASLSGSTNASDIAERRRLEADLYGAREELDDTYYEHAKETQQEALDNEAEAYEETMNRFIEGLRLGLDQATVNMDEFLMSVTSMVTLNANTVLAKYEATELPLGDAITNPWKAAIEKVGKYDGDALALINKWTQGGFFDDYKTGVSSDLSSPWNAGSIAADAFKTSVDTVMDDVVAKIQTNVKTASDELSELYSQILDTEKRAQNVGAEGGSSNNGNNTHGNFENVVADKPQVEAPKVEAKPLTEAQKLVPQITRFGTAEGSGMNAGSKGGDNGVVEWDGESFKVQNSGITYRPGQPLYDAAVKHLKFGDRQIFGWRGGVYGYLDGVIQRLEGRTLSKAGYNNLVAYAKKKYSKFAKGTTGTKRDEWAITDEPQFGDELVLVPGKDGNLSFMRKGTGVVPADLTANLMEWGKFDPSSMNLGSGVNVNMINNAVNKPEFNLSVDNFLRCDNVSQDSLPELKQFVKEQMNSLVKQMNYSLKKSGAR